MTAPRFRVLGNGGALVADRNAFGLNFLGRATLVSTTQASGVPEVPDGRRAGYSTFSFAHAGPILPAAELRTGKTVAVLGCTQSGSTWTITVHCGGAASDWDDSTAQFHTQYGLEVYVFGILTSASGVGLRLRNDSGVLTHVFTDTDGRPLYPRGLVTEDGSAIDTTTVRTIPSLAKPAAIGFPGHVQRSATAVGLAYRNRERRLGWRWDGSTGLALSAQTRWLHDEDGAITTTWVRPSNTFIIDAQGL